VKKISKGKPDSRFSRRSARANLLVAAGVLVIALGVYGLVRPNLLMPAKRQTLQIAGQNVVMETRRIVAIPRPLSGLLIFGGLGLILMGIQRP
jgi:hypothetical protein